MTSPYKPRITVVRVDPTTDVWWRTDDGLYPNERAYLVRGAPMPGTEVVVKPPSGEPYRRTVKALEIDNEGALCVLFTTEEWDPLCIVHPYNPDDERLRVATRAVRNQYERRDSPNHEDIARAVLEALEATDD